VYVTRNVQSFSLAGGLNLSQEQIRLQPGEVVAGQNIEVAIGGGYRRTDGYNRFDGHELTPSNNTYSVLTFSNGGPREFAEGDIISGFTSGATAEVCGPATVATGTFAGINAAGTLGVTLVTGTFTVGETIRVSGINAATCSAAPVPADLDDVGRDSWIRGAANRARARISAVPGSGPVRGIAVYNGKTYAFRDNADATAGVMWQATTSGWAEVDFTAFKLLAFNTGIALLTEGMAINGMTSGATAVVRRVAFRSGTWGTTAAGMLVLTDIVGSFTLAESIRVGATVYATTGATLASVTIPAGGRYQFDQWNFYGSYDTTRLYWVNRVGTGFEFDNNGTIPIAVPIASGMPVDVPENIAVHKNYLFFTFKGSVQNSGAGEPHSWTARLGAQEFGMGEYVTALRSIRQDVLGIATKNSIGLLYGSSALDWSLKKLSREVGCASYCMTEIPSTTAIFDTNGVISLAATQDFGDLKPTTMSVKIDKALRAIHSTPIALVTNRNLSQLRLYFDDGKAFYATFIGSKIAGWAPILHPHTFNCVAVGEDANGAEVQYAGDTDGYVYQLNDGNSFDGTEIDSWIRLPFHHYGTPERKKRFRKIVIEMDSPSALNLQWATEFNYGDPQYATHSPVFVPNSGGLFDEGVFGLFTYDGGFLTAPLAYIAGVGKNMSILIRQSSDIARPWSMQAIHIHFSPWGVQR